MKDLFTGGFTGAGALVRAMRSSWVVRVAIRRLRWPGLIVAIVRRSWALSAVVTLGSATARSNGVAARS